MARIFISAFSIVLLICNSGLAQSSKDAEILDKLKNSDVNVRKNAIWSIKDIQDSSTILPLLEIFQQEKSSGLLRSDFMYSVAELVSRLPNPQALEPLINILNEEKDASVQRDATRAIGYLKTPEAKKFLLNALKNNPHAEVRFTVTLVYRDYPVLEVVDPLIDALKDRNESVRDGAAITLEMLSDATPEYLNNEKAIQYLIDAIDRKDPMALGNHSICVMLLKLKSPYSVKPLLSLLKEEIDPSLRVSVGEILQSIPGEKTPELEEFLAKKKIAKEDINYADEQGNLTRLAQAVTDNNVEGVKKLLSQGAHINAGSYYGVTPLMCAASGGNIALAQLLISQGADVSIKDAMGTTVLFYAIQKGDMKMVKFLVEMKADLICASIVSGETPYDVAKANGFEEIASFLKSKGAKEGQGVHPPEQETLEPKNKEEAGKQGLSYFAFLYSTIKDLYGNDLKAGDYAVYSQYGHKGEDARKLEVRVTERDGDTVEIMETAENRFSLTIDFKKMKLLNIYDPETKEAIDSSALETKNVSQLADEFRKSMSNFDLLGLKNRKYTKIDGVQKIEVTAGTFECSSVELSYPDATSGMPSGIAEKYKENIYFSNKVPKLIPQSLVIFNPELLDVLSIRKESNDGLVKAGTYELIEYSK